MQEARQLALDGTSHPATGHPIRDQLARIMEAEPETQKDEDLLAARWLQEHGGYGHWDAVCLADIVSRTRKNDIRRRRQELVHMGYPWPEEEAERRKQRSKGGRP